MTLWFSSDTHFSHRKIVSEFEPERSKKWSSIEEMNEGIIEAHNDLVKKNDDVWFLGDCSFGSEKIGIELFRRMNGHKNLILGNHDKFKKLEPWLKAFDTIQHYKEISWYNQKICLFHFGQRIWNKSHRGAWHLHGHSHGSIAPHGKSVDVGLDSPWITGRKEHRPFSFEEIKSFMDLREISIVDRHGA